MCCRPGFSLQQLYMLESYIACNNREHISFIHQSHMYNQTVCGLVLFMRSVVLPSGWVYQVFTLGGAHSNLLQVISFQTHSTLSLFICVYCAMGSGPSAAGPTDACAKCRKEAWVTLQASSSCRLLFVSLHPLFIFALFQNHGWAEGAHFYCHQARWCAEGHHRRGHQEVRDEGLQTCRHEDAPCKSKCLSVRLWVRCTLK